MTKKKCEPTKPNYVIKAYKEKDNGMYSYKAEYIVCTKCGDYIEIK